MDSGGQPSRKCAIRKTEDRCGSDPWKRRRSYIIVMNHTPQYTGGTPSAETQPLNFVVSAEEHETSFSEVKRQSLVHALRWLF
jgi:hypothetical protein